MFCARSLIKYPGLRRAIIDQAQVCSATEIIIEDKGSGTC
jgi:hypothetical protein